MPDLSDLHDEFARLEQEIPQGYRSPVITARVSSLLGETERIVVRPRRWVLPVAILATAAAVVVLALAMVSISGRPHGNGRVAVQPTSRQTTTPPSPTPRETSTQASPSGSSHPNNTMPTSSSQLQTYVVGATPVTLSEYERGELGPGQPMVSTPGSAQFNTPSGNISCDTTHGSAGDASGMLVCSVAQFSYSIPTRPASCNFNWVPYLSFYNGGAVSKASCTSNPAFGPTTETLPYGATIRQGNIACRSESEFLACADLTSGHGFAVNRDTLKTY